MAGYGCDESEFLLFHLPWQYWSHTCTEKGRKKNVKGFEGLIEEGREGGREGGIKDKGNGRIEKGGEEKAGKRGSRHREGRRKRFGRGMGGKEGGKLLRVYSTVLWEGSHQGLWWKVQAFWSLEVTAYDLVKAWSFSKVDILTPNSSLPGLTITFWGWARAKFWIALTDWLHVVLSRWLTDRRLAGNVDILKWRGDYM